MNILFASDLHGQVTLYDELFRLALEQQYDCVVLGGDLLPTKMGALTKLVSGKIDLDAGLQAQIDFIDTSLAPRIKEFIQARPGVSVLYIPGNHDWVAAMEHLAKRVPQAINLHLKEVRLSGYSFCGYACVTDSSFWVKDYVRRDFATDGFVASRYAGISTPRGIQLCPDNAYITRHPSIQEELESMPMDDPGHAICIFHCPPFDTGLDTLHNGQPIGSRAIKEFITKRQPLVSLHGHIHESPYMSGLFHIRIGRTLAVNAGHSHKHLHAVSFEGGNPEETLTHSLFGAKHPVLDEYRLERYGLKFKALALQTLFSK